ncbi:MAG: vWA domain-containing protein [Candidatus Kapaibacteriota bacterium]
MELSQRTILRNSAFFSRMVEYGFLESSIQALPDDFTLVYEISRILEDIENPLTTILSPVLWLSEHNPEDKSSPKEVIPHLPTGEEYEANLIRSYRDINKIYPHQYLLPDEVFMQRLVERSLWMPSPKAPRNKRYQSDSSDFAPDSRKQKVYLLFDTSKSMQESYRIHLAKAIAYFFLKNNQKEMGTIFFRTFDADIGKLHVVQNRTDFDELITEIMCMPAEGRGTILEKALLTAIQDIRHDSFMSEAEILVITDGAAHIDTAKIRQALGASIRIHCVKIGDAKIDPDHKLILNTIHSSETEEAKSIRDIQHKIKDMESSLRSTHIDNRKHAILSEIQFLQKQLNDKIQRYSVKAMSNYGNEIVELSSIFVNVADVNPKTLFTLSKDRIDEFVKLSREILQLLKEDPSAEDAKLAAVLYDHIETILRFNDVDIESLNQQKNDLGTVLTDMVQQHLQYQKQLQLSDNDQLQLSKILRTGLKKASRIPLAKLLIIFIRMIINNIRGLIKKRELSNIKKKRSTLHQRK